MALRVLVVDDDQGLRTIIKEVLIATHKYEVEEAFDGLDAVEKAKANLFDIVLLDVDMPRLSGLEALKQIKAHHPGAIVLMMTAFATIDSAVEAVKNGAYNYLSKPVSGADLVEILERAIEAHRLIFSVAASSPVLMDEGKKIIGNTAQMQKVFSIISRVSKVETPVLIRGASGTGKEVVARAIHFNSPRKEGRFVAINCSAIPENLFESEFFGHEKGSFTGADQRKIGKFQYAEGGTLFLDEVGDLPLHMQVKLLRVLQEKVFTPVGSLREIQTNVRVIAATNRPLDEMIKQGSFREDLFYRLNVIPIFLPPLSERREDIPTMIDGFIRKFNNLHHRKMTGVDPMALKILLQYDWPGNIRELENVIEHAFVMENKNRICLSSLPGFVLEASGVSLQDWAFDEEACGESLGEAPNSFGNQDHMSQDPLNLETLSSQSRSGGLGATGLNVDLQEDPDFDGDEDSLRISGSLGTLASSPAGASLADPGLDFNLQKEAFEKEFIIRALKAFRGRINQTALHANIPKKTLLRKIEKYGINARDYSV